MKRSKALVASRRDEITAILEVRGQVSVAELAEHFDVSALTIRRDLDYLESQQVLTRQYGTATLLNPFGRPSGSRQIRANKAIAREAARYVEDGDCIFINTSSTGWACWSSSPPRTSPSSPTTARRSCWRSARTCPFF